MFWNLVDNGRKNVIRAENKLFCSFFFLFLTDYLSCCIIQMLQIMWIGQCHKTAWKILIRKIWGQSTQITRVKNDKNVVIKSWLLIGHCSLQPPYIAEVELVRVHPAVSESQCCSFCSFCDPLKPDSKISKQCLCLSREESCLLLGPEEVKIAVSWAVDYVDAKIASVLLAPNANLVVVELVS